MFSEQGEPTATQNMILHTATLFGITQCYIYSMLSHVLPTNVIDSLDINNFT